MKNILQQIIAQNKEREKGAAAERQAEIDSPTTKDNRRSFLKKTALGGMTMSALAGLTFEDTMAQTTSKVQKASSRPSTWSASSRVGAMMSARTARRGPGKRRSRMGSTNAAVLPVPVWARPMTSLPSRTGGMACFWMGVHKLQAFFKGIFFDNSIRIE